MGFVLILAQIIVFHCLRNGVHIYPSRLPSVHTFGMPPLVLYIFNVCLSITPQFTMVLCGHCAVALHKNFWGKTREKWKGQQLFGIDLRTPLAWVVTTLPLSYDNQTTMHAPALTIFYMTSTVLHKWYWSASVAQPCCSHSVCAIRTLLGTDRKILSIRRESMLSDVSSI